MFKSRKKIITVSIGMVPYGEYIIHITKSFVYGTLFEFYNKNHEPLDGYELYVVGESFRTNNFRIINQLN